MPAFIDAVRLCNKEISKLEIIKHSDSDGPVAVNISFNLNDNEGPLEYSKDDVQKLTIQLNAHFVDSKKYKKLKEKQSDLTTFDVKPLFVAKLELDVYVKFVKELKCKVNLIEDFPEQILSFAYDDMKLILEENLNRTSYKGFTLPFDFRDIIELHK